MDNASIHHTEGVADLIENQAGARLIYLPPYSPDLHPAEEVFSEVKSIMKQNDSVSISSIDPILPPRDRKRQDDPMQLRADNPCRNISSQQPPLYTTKYPHDCNTNV